MLILFYLPAHLSGCRSITPAHWESPRHETTQLFGSITMKGALPARQDRVLLNGGFLGSDSSNQNRIAAEANKSHRRTHCKMVN